MKFKISNFRALTPKLLTIAVAVTGTLVFVLVYWLSHYAPAVLYRKVVESNPTKKPLICIFNPLRNREVEVFAEDFLRAIKDDGCPDRLRYTSADSGWIQDICKRERLYRLTNFTLIDRRQVENQVTLFYQGSRISDRGESQSPIWIYLEKDDNDWKVTKYSCFY